MKLKEFLQGELSNRKQALLPIIAAVGGMLVPALIYIFINFENPETLRGWAIPSATDIAFLVLSLLGSRVPLSLKVFLTALAIIDDLGAIVIIAFFYTGDLNIIYLTLLLLVFIALLILNKLNIRKFLPYLLLGLILWFFTHESKFMRQYHVLLATVIPHRKKEKDFSLLVKIEHKISPYADWYNAFICLSKCCCIIGWCNFNSLLSPIPLGIVLGLLLANKWEFSFFNSFN